MTAASARGLAAAMVLAALLGSCRAAPPAVSKPSPNVLLYVVDTLRADSLSCYGHPVVETPHLDRAARAGLLFETAWAQAPWTRASMASLFTSTHPAVHSVTDKLDRLPANLPTVGESFQKAGYRSGYIVSNPNVGAQFGFGRGFHDVVEMFGRAVPGEADDRDMIASSDEVTERAIAWIDGAPRPFFLTVLTIDPHHPYGPPAAFDRYSAILDAGVPRPISPRSHVEPPLHSEAERERIRTLYYGEIAFNDLSFGRLLAHLRHLGIARETTLVMTADHGEELWEHGRLGHGQALHEESVRIPLFVSHPGRVPSSLVTHPVQSIDVFPTLIELASLPTPSGIEGHALHRGQTDEPVLWSGLAFAGHDEVAIMAPPLKVIWDLESGRSWQYDLTADAAETRHVDARTSYRGRALLERMEQMMKHGKKRREELELCQESYAEQDLPAEVKQALRQLGYLD